MLMLGVRVPDGDNRTAVATLRDGPRLLLKDYAVTTPHAGLGQQHGNPTGDPLRPFGPVPRGGYSLVALAPTPADAVAEYGSHLLVFEPQSGPALQAESFGRLVLLAYAGPSGRELRLRRTQGGLRLTVALVNAIVSHLSADTELELRVEPLSMTPPPWWAFWKPRPENIRPLSVEPPRFLAPPLDEATMAAHALRNGRRRRLRRYDPDTDTWRDPSTSGTSASRSDPQSSTERATPFESGGGRSGGAGASGAWDAESSRPPGVDSAGRILGTAAAAAAAAAAIGLSGIGQTPTGDAPGESPTASNTTNVSTNY